MNADQFLEITETRLPTAEELVELVRSLGGRVMVVCGKPQIRVPGVIGPEFYAVAKLLKREPWRSAAISMAEVVDTERKPPPRPTTLPPKMEEPDPGEPQGGPEPTPPSPPPEPPPQTRAQMVDQILTPLILRSREAREKIWLIDAKGHEAKDKTVAVLACVAGDKEWVRLPPPEPEEEENSLRSKSRKSSRG